MSNDVVLSARKISKSFAGFKAVTDVDLTVRRGTVHAMIGPNGAGKTTVFNLLTRFLPVTSGAIFFGGRNITNTNPAAIARMGIVRSFQISAIFPHLTARENIGIALQRPSGLSYSFWRSERSLKFLDEKIEKLAADFNLLEFLDRPAGELSYGRRRALELATTMGLDPELVLLDEPMAGLGINDIDHVADLIRQIAVKHTVLMVEHNLSVVARISDVITVLTRGRVLAEGSYSEISQNRSVQEAYIGGVHA
jgi:branched-chain amino acid transport system ATP-binding protein